MSNNDVSKNSSDELHETQVISSPTYLKPGECLLGRFEIEAMCGQGQYGCVYRAYDKQLDTHIAIKVLNQSISQQSDAIAKFKQELLHLRQLSHPTILRVHEYYHWQNLHFITMDWIDGQSLEEASLTFQSREELITFVSQLLEALVFVEQANVVHRDIKPANIMLDKKGRLYISDFGLSVLEGSADVGDIVGTVHYAPPEYLQFGAVNSTTDLYAVGVVLYQLCCGELPFTGQSLDEVLTAKQLNKAKCRVKHKQLAFIAPFINKLIHSQVNARFKNATEAQTAFLKQIKEKPHNIKKHSMLMAVVVVIGLFIMAAVFLSMPHDTPQQPEKEYYAVAVLPLQSSDDSVAQGLAEYINYQLHELGHLRVVEQGRLSQLLSQLGITMPLDEQKLALVADLLNVSYLIAPQLYPSGSEQHDIKFNVYQLEGHTLQKNTLLTSDFNQANWQQSVSSFTERFSQQLQLSTEVKALQVDPQPAGELFIVKSFLQKGEFEKAQTSLSQFLAKHPNSGLGWLLQGELLLATQQFFDAENAYNQALKFAEDKTYTAKFASARLNDLAGKADQAQADYAALVKAFPYDVELKIALAEFYFLTEQHQKMEALLLEVVNLDPYHPDAWFMLGRAAFLQGQYQKAVDEYFVKALVTAKKSKNAYQEGEALNAFGVVYNQLGEIDLAFDYYRQALAIRENIDDIAGMATTMGNLSSLHLAKAQYTEAERYLQQSISLYEQLGDQEGLSHTFNELGVLEEEQALYQKALEYYQQGLDIRMTLGNQMLQAESMNNIGFMYFMLLNKKHALVYWRQAEQLYQGIQYPLGIIHVRQNLGQIELAQGNWRNAYHLFNNTLADAKQLNSTFEQWVSRSYLSKLTFLQGNFANSITELSAIYEQAKSLQDIRAMSEFGLWLVDWSYQLGDITGAASTIASLKQDIADKGNREYVSRLAFYSELITSEMITQQQMSEPMSKDHSQGAIYIAKLIYAAREALRQQQDISAHLAALGNVDFTLYQYAYLEYLELLAVQQFMQQQWPDFQATLKQADILLRKMGGYWRSFQFDRLRVQFAYHNEQAPSSLKAKLNSELNTLLANLPKDRKAEFLNYQSYFQLDDSLQDLAGYE